MAMRMKGILVLTIEIDTRHRDYPLLRCAAASPSTVSRMQRLAVGCRPERVVSSLASMLMDG